MRGHTGEDCGINKIEKRFLYNYAWGEEGKPLLLEWNGIFINKSTRK